MLEELHISQLALIDRLTLTLSPGLNVLSGETGAGKSILIKAVNLLLGEKPAPDTVRQGADACQVEALFSLQEDHPLLHQLEEAGIPVDDHLIIKRIVQDNGKSRAWINGSPISQGLLARVTRTLLEISNQHEYQSLLNPVQHLYLLDRFGGLLPLREEVQRDFQNLEASVKDRNRLLEEEEKRKSQEALWRFQLQEIREAELRPGEDQELKQQRQVLQQAEKIWEKVHLARQILSEEDRSGLNALAAAKDLIRTAASWDQRLLVHFQELETMQLQVKEISTDLRDYLSGLVFDPARLEEVEDRLERIRRLTAKYGSTVEEVLEYGREIEGRLQKGEDRQFHRKQLEEEIVRGRERLYEKAQALSQQRKQAARELAARVEKELHDLGMKDCRFETVFSGLENDGPAEDGFVHQGILLGRTGLERGEFYLAPNPGEGLRPLSRIASGGELSRILLVLKKLLSQQDALETLIFDEVDAGIGGSLGEAVGRKLAELARRHQVLCITHLPQIAAFADTHFQVHKTVRRQRTQTRIRLLNQEERLVELARMLGGDPSSSETVSLARELLKRAGTR